MTGAQEAPSDDAKAPPAARNGGGLLQWFWRGQALGQARAYRSDMPTPERQALERALVAAELAERALDPVDALRSGSATTLGISLYREAAYWALCAQSADYAERSLAAVMERVPTPLLESAAGGAEALQRVRRALVERDFVATSELPPDLLPTDAQAARVFVQALLRDKLSPERRVGGLMLQRIVRCFAVVLLVVLAAAGARFLLSPTRRAPDLAAGKPWRASSSPDKCNPKQHRCAGAHTDMFFTTSEELSPWLEIDLGANTTFNSLEVTNRSDCCPDRAVPLIAEVSRDQAQWREVVRRDDTFGVWQTRFATQTARYLRLRVPRRSTFHLDKVEVKHVR